MGFMDRFRQGSDEPTFRQPYEPGAREPEPEPTPEPEPPKKWRPIVDPATGDLLSVQPDAAESSIRRGGVDYTPNRKERP